MVWVIAFEDGDDLNYWRTELYDSDDEFIGYGDIETFKTKEQAEDFRLKYTDSRCFDFYSTEIRKDEDIYENRDVMLLEFIANSEKTFEIYGGVCEDKKRKEQQ